MSKATIGKSDQSATPLQLDTSGMSFTGKIAAWSAAPLVGDCSLSPDPYLRDVIAERRRDEAVKRQ